MSAVSKMIGVFLLVFGASFASAKDSVYLGKQEWINDKDEKVQLNSLEGKKQIVAMIFTRCPSACPFIVQDIRDLLVNVSAKAKSKVQVSLFSFDTFRENRASLADFRKKFNLDDQWSLYRSDEKNASMLAALLSVSYRRLESGDYVHSNQIYLLNEKGEIDSMIEGFDTERSDFIKQLKAL